MTYAVEKVKAGRRPFSVVELDLDACSLTYSNAPCTASLTGSNGKCFNTFATCQDTANFDLETKTYSFCSPEIGKSRAYDAIPSVRKIDVTPMKLDPGLSLGKRGAAKITFQDHPHHDRGVDKYALERADGTAGVPAYTPHDQGSFWGKLTARNPHHVARIMRLKTGFIPWDQDLNPSNQASVSAAAAIADVLTRTYAIEQIDGPDASGRVTVTGKDLLKLADDERAECPERNTGVLVGRLESGTLALISSSYDTVNLNPVGGGSYNVGRIVSHDGDSIFLMRFEIGGGLAREIRRWDMATPFDVSTAAFVAGQSLSLNVAGFTNADGWITSDGLHVIALDNNVDEIFSFTLSTAFDLTSAVLDGAGLRFTTTSGVNRVDVSPSGSRLFQLDGAADTFGTWELSTPFDFSTAVFMGEQNQIDLSQHSEVFVSFNWGKEGTLIGFYGITNDKVHWYALTKPYDLSTAVYKGSSSDLDASGESATGVSFTFNDQKAYTISNTDDTIYQYSWSLANTANLLPAGVGNLEYDASGTLRIEDELLEFTRSGDVLSFTKRGAVDTVTESHPISTIVQQCFKFDDQQIDLIIGTLLKDFAGISTIYIDEATWATEASTFLSTFVYTALITEPTGVRKLINELCLQSNCLLYWHETDAEFKFVALRQPATELTVTEENMIAGSFKQADLPKLRLTRVTIRFNRATGTARLDSPTSFLQTYQAVDADAETVNEFGDVRHMTINSRWMGSGDLAIATEAADAILARYVDTPQQFNFALDVKDADIWTGSIISIQSRYEQDIFGADGSVVAQVIEVRETPNGGFIYKAISI